MHLEWPGDADGRHRLETHIAHKRWSRRYNGTELDLHQFVTSKKTAQETRWELYFGNTLAGVRVLHHEFKLDFALRGCLIWHPQDLRHTERAPNLVIYHPYSLRPPQTYACNRSKCQTDEVEALMPQSSASKINFAREWNNEKHETPVLSIPS